jgi:hypothetical protein
MAAGAEDRFCSGSRADRPRGCGFGDLGFRAASRVGQHSPITLIASTITARAETDGGGNLTAKHASNNRSVLAAVLKRPEFRAAFRGLHPASGPHPPSVYADAVRVQAQDLVSIQKLRMIF